MLTLMSTEQIAIRLPAEQLELLDRLVGRGVYASRAEAVRAGIAAVVELDRRRQEDRAILAGYEQIPPTEAEQSAALASMRDAISEEPW
jgi:Arc/MetJ-type ribon-helix-helix transcriptional regulator